MFLFIFVDLETLTRARREPEEKSAGRNKPDQQRYQFTWKLTNIAKFELLHASRGLFFNLAGVLIPGFAPGGDAPSGHLLLSR